MSILSGVSSFFGLDIGTSAIRLVELTGSGPIKTVGRYAYAPIDSRITLSDAKSDQQKLAQTISELIRQSGITTRNVAVGIPSQRVFTTVVDFERLPGSEMNKAIRFQADSLIPTPLADSKIDWALLGDSPGDKTKVEILLSSVANDFIEQRLDMLEQLGLNVIAFEPDNLALARALVPPDADKPYLVLDIGDKTTDLVISSKGAPRLTRAIPTGIEAIVRAASQNLNVDEKQADQFVFKFGLAKDKLEGRVEGAIIGVIETLTTEIEKSIKFFTTRYGGTEVGRISVTGGASTLPGFPLHIANKFGSEVEVGNAWRNVSVSPERQNELLAISNHFSVAVGLAERTE